MLVASSSVSPARELRVGLTHRECKAWIDVLRNPPRGARLKATANRVASRRRGLWHRLLIWLEKHRPGPG
jgi:hypothetical protein